VWKSLSSEETFELQKVRDALTEAVKESEVGKYV